MWLIDKLKQVTRDELRLWNSFTNSSPNLSMQAVLASRICKSHNILNEQVFQQKLQIRRWPPRRAALDQLWTPYLRSNGKELKKVKLIQLFDFLNFGIFTEIVSISLMCGHTLCSNFCHPTRTMMVCVCRNRCPFTTKFKTRAPSLDKTFGFNWNYLWLF